MARAVLPLLAILSLPGLAVDGWAQGFDTGQSAPELAAALAGGLAAPGSQGLWLRVRGVPDPIGAKAGEVGEHRAALGRLRQEGYRVCMLLFPSAASWAKGVRSSPRSRLPLDLREAHAWMARLQGAYGDLVDAWEIDNEPDIQFVVENPEAYAAYLKACWWGAAAGQAERKSEFSTQRTQRARSFGLCGLGGLCVKRIGTLEEEGGRRTNGGAASDQGLRTKGAKDQGTKEVREQGTKGVRDQGTKGPRDQGTKGAGDQETKGAGDQGTKGPKDQGTGGGWTNGGDERREAGGQRAIDDSQLSALSSQLSALGSSSALARVMMGGLAMPPGPYLERFIANDGLTYTDGFNYHCYGYAEDFTGYYRQFKRAVTEVGDERREAREERAETVWVKRTLPVFLTEYGFGMLTAEDRGEVAGRVRQWEWFRDAGSQARKLRIEGAMAFLLMPYLEYNAKEYGLTITREARGEKREARGERPEAEGLRAEVGVLNTEVAENAEGAKVEKAEGPKDQGARDQRTRDQRTRDQGTGGRRRDSVFRAGGMDFRPGDFGAKRVEPWMEGIGKMIAGNEASPAMAWLLDDAKTPRKASRGWTIDTPEPSEVVIDFVGGSGTTATKQRQGYLLSIIGASRAAGGGWLATGAGELRVYNFGRGIVRGRLELGPIASGAGGSSVELSLLPGEMRGVPVNLSIPAGTMKPNEWRVRYLPADSGAGSVFSTLLYGIPPASERNAVYRFSAEAAGPRNTAKLERRSLARGEPTEHSAGGWRVTRDVEVSEHAGEWTFTVGRLPAEPARPAVVELVLPDDFQLPARSLLELEYRIVAASDMGGAAERSPQATTFGRADIMRNSFGVYWRTANGNLFTVWRPPPATEDWQRYAQAKESFTMSFYGRSEKHWRFSDNRPVALVFTFLPATLPATFQIRKAAIIEYGREGK